MKLRIAASYSALAACAILALPTAASAWQSDNGDGTFTNPPLYADYPDPDIIRVKDDFFFVTTTFVNSPALRLLHSKDLVNWEIVTHIIPRLDGNPKYDLEDGGDYRRGMFAPSLRYRDGVFYVAVTPVGQATRIYRSEKPEGPWTFREIGVEAFDPALHFEPDGSAYILSSACSDGTLSLFTLNEGLDAVTAQENIYFNKGAEGSKLIRRGEWYYLFNAIPSRLGMTVSRARDLRGPWETRNQIDTQSGGHQGALVDLPDGRWYGFAHRDSGAIGRMTQISPIYWEDDWPVWGTPDAPMQVPAVAAKPVQGQAVAQPETSDEFDSPRLGLQWAWNHNPDNSLWSLAQRQGWLRLKATKADELWTARNTITQKGQGPWSSAVVKMDLSNLRPGDVCGFGSLGKFCGGIVVFCEQDGSLSLGMEIVEDTPEGRFVRNSAARLPLERGIVYLRTKMDFEAASARCSYSLDGLTWTEHGGVFPLAYDWRTGTFQGPQYAVFCYNAAPDGGYVDVDWFHFSDRRE
ncbi:MAG: glycoside hydrolase 43 family protein [Opitutales bacterium]|nr:glycoside hydrolase 43 family protein [Opitutales bacterium]